MGGPLGGPRVALESPSAILKLLKNHKFSLHFEPLNLSDAAKGTRKNAKLWTLMQVKSRHYQESRRKQNGSSFSTKNGTKECLRTTKRAPKSYANHRLEGSQNSASPKVRFLVCIIGFFVVASDPFLFALRRAQELQGGRSEIPGGGWARRAERAPQLSKRGPGGAPGRPKATKVRK